MTAIDIHAAQVQARDECRCHRARRVGVVQKPSINEKVRVQRLLDAEAKAALLFDEIEPRAMIRAGIGEQDLADEIHKLAGELFGVTRRWHRRIVRAGEKTLRPFREHPPDRMIADGDIVFLDLGPVFEELTARSWAQSSSVIDSVRRIWCLPPTLTRTSRPLNSLTHCSTPSRQAWVEAISTDTYAPRSTPANTSAKRPVSRPMPKTVAP
jgi:hypothetical protein